MYLYQQPSSGVEHSFPAVRVIVIPKAFTWALLVSCENFVTGSIAIYIFFQFHRQQCEYMTNTKLILMIVMMFYSNILKIC